MINEENMKISYEEEYDEEYMDDWWLRGEDPPFY